MSLSDLLVCKYSKVDGHLLKSPLVLSCGHTFCESCLKHGYLQDQVIQCKICRSLDKEKPDDLMVNQFVNEIFKTFPQIYKNILTDHKNETRSLDNS